MAYEYPLDPDEFDKLDLRLSEIESLIEEYEARRKFDGWWLGVALLLVGLQVYSPGWWEGWF